MKLDKREQLSNMVARQMMTLVANYAKILDNDLTGPQYYVLQTLAYEGHRPAHILPMP